MSISASSKKSIPLSVSDRSRLDTKHATRARAAEKVLDASNPIPLSDLELNNIQDQQKMRDKSKLARVEKGYKVFNV